MLAPLRLDMWDFQCVLSGTYLPAKVPSPSAKVTGFLDNLPTAEKAAYCNTNEKQNDKVLNGTLRHHLIRKWKVQSESHVHCFHLLQRVVHEFVPQGQTLSGAFP